MSGLIGHYTVPIHAGMHSHPHDGDGWVIPFPVPQPDNMKDNVSTNPSWVVCLPSLMPYAVRQECSTQCACRVHDRIRDCQPQFLGLQGQLNQGNKLGTHEMEPHTLEGNSSDTHWHLWYSTDGFCRRQQKVLNGRWKMSGRRTILLVHSTPVS